MNRRGMIQAALAALASIPCVGLMMPSQAVIMPVSRRFKTLEDVRYYLLPGLRATNQDNPDVVLDIETDRDNGMLIVKGFHTGWPDVELAFAITRQSIADHNFGSFRPDMLYLIAALRRADFVRSIDASYWKGKSDGVS